MSGVATAVAAEAVSRVTQAGDLEQGKAQGKPVTWRGRIARVLRVTPGILALIVSLVAIVCALVWNSPYLCIPFGIGAVCSVYLIYLGYSHGKTLEKQRTLDENITKTHDTVLALTGERRELQGEVRNLNGQNKVLGTHCQDLGTQVGVFKKENGVLKAQIGEFAKECKALEEARTQLEGFNESLKRQNQEAAEKVRNLNKSLNTVSDLGGTLASMQKALESDHQAFGAHLEKFRGLVAELTDANIEGMAKNLVHVFEVIGKWFTDETTKEYIDRLTNAKVNYDAESRKLRDAMQSVSDAATTLASLNSQAEAASKLESDKLAEVSRLQGEQAALVRANQNLAESLGKSADTLNSMIDRLPEATREAAKAVLDEVRRQATTVQKQVRQIQQASTSSPLVHAQ